MGRAACPEPVQLVCGLGRAAQADRAVTSLPSELPKAAGKSLHPVLGFSLGAAVWGLGGKADCEE